MPGEPAWNAGGGKTRSGQTGGHVNPLQLLQLILTLGNALIPALKLQSDVPAEVIADAEAGLALLNKVNGSEVTFGQLEGLRLSPAWGDAPPQAKV